MKKKDLTILLAPNSFKNNIDSIEIAKHIAAGLKRSNPRIKVITKPLADGGDGSVKVLRKYTKGHIKYYETINPHGKRIESPVFWFDNNSHVFIETASSSGLQVCDRIDPMTASTHGTGILIRKVINEGAKNILLGIGGTATSDLGCGIMQELGVEFYNSEHKSIRIQSGNIGKIDSFETSKAQQLLEDNDVKITCVCDNHMQLSGEEVSSMTLLHKGATLEQKELLKVEINHLLDKIKDITGKEPKNKKWLGCGGGIPGGLNLLLNVSCLSGADYFIDISKTDEIINKCDYILTGEGIVDISSFSGKLTQAILKRYKHTGIPIILFTALLRHNYTETLNKGFKYILNVDNSFRPIEDIKRQNSMPQILMDFGHNLANILTS